MRIATIMEITTEMDIGMLNPISPRILIKLRRDIYIISILMLLMKEVTGNWILETSSTRSGQVTRTSMTVDTSKWREL